MSDVIESVKARKILDSRGDWTIEVVILLSKGSIVKSSVPQGKSKGSNEAVYVPVGNAIENINEVINKEVKGKKLSEQKEFDNFLIELDGSGNKSRLGANSILGLSLAYARASAIADKVPLWKYLREIYGVNISNNPYLYVNLINGGLHAGNNLDFQEYMIIPKTRSYSKGVEAAVDIYHGMRTHLIETLGAAASNLGDEGGCAPYFPNALAPFEILEKIIERQELDIDIGFGLDAAANNIKKSSQVLTKLYSDMSEKFNLYYLEDPYRESDFGNFSSLLNVLGKSVVICGDDLTVTNIKRIKKAHDKKSINGVLIKPNQIGTVTETLDAVRLTKKYGYSVIVSHRSGETNDDFIVDLAHGVGADGVKIGAPARGERVAKFNRFLEISDEMIY